jgi:amino acid permease
MYIIYPVNIELLILFVLFLFAIVLSVLRFMDSEYPFGIFKLFLTIYFMAFKHISIAKKCTRRANKSDDDDDDDDDDYDDDDDEDDFLRFEY